MWSHSATRGLLLVAILTASCTERDPDYCAKNSDCSGHRVCDVVRATCIAPDAAVAPVNDAGVADAAADVAVDSPVGVDGGGSAVDASTSVDVAQASEAGRPVDARVADAALPDVFVPDAAGTCGVSGDCTDPTKAFCVAGVCVGCQSAGTTACGAQACDAVSGRCVECVTDTGCTKDPAKAFCVLNACTACSTTGATGCTTRTDGRTACAATGVSAGQCVECVADTDCTKDPAKAFCVANACTGCGTSGATGCAARTDGRTACAASGTSAGQCVECLADTGCTKDPAKSFCVANACTGCATPGATGCTGRTDGRLVCATSGTAAGQCVECTGDSQCTSSVAKGFCVANACTGCNTAGATGCTGRTDGRAVCASTGTLAGQCVACAASGDCKVATSPICTAANVCVACTADSQCVAKLGTTGNPGVCMVNIDGHCATDAETIYVQNVTGCSNSATSGTSAVPFCDATIGVNAAVSTNGKILAVLAGALSSFSVSAPAKPLTIVGKAAMVTPAAFSDGITITAGEVYLRGITVQGSTIAQTKAGINAGTGVTLHMDTCSIINNPGGGILLNGAAFDIENTTVTGNGPGTFSGLPWGGVLMQNIPASGPTTLNLVTVQNNNGGGVACSGAITGTGVLATGNTNTVSQIGASCGFTSCSASAASATCGAQSTP